MRVSLVRIEVSREFRVGLGHLADTYEPAHCPVVVDSDADLIGVRSRHPYRPIHRTGMTINVARTYTRSLLLM